MIIDDFDKITGLDFNAYLSRFKYFVEKHVPVIVGFYKGTYAHLSHDVYTELNALKTESKRYTEAILKHSHRFDNAEYWEIAEVIDEMAIRLKTIERTPRWVRSTFASLDKNTNTEVDVNLPSMTTLEELAARSGYEDPQNSWVSIAMRNDLDEEDYTPDGGNLLNVNLAGGNSVIINDVVDVMSGDNAYGKDIYRVMTFENDDLVTVEGEACMIQCYEVLIGMQRGSVPEFPEMGIGEVLAGNIAAFAYPTILRQVHRTMYRDDSVESVGINKFDTDGDAVIMDIFIESKFGKYIRTGLQI